MKKLFLSALITLFIIGANHPSFALDDYTYMSIEEYQKFFEMGLTDDSDDEKEAFKPKLKEKLDLNSPDVIGISDDALELKIEKSAFLAPYREIFKEESAKTSFYKTDRFDLFSDGGTELSRYMNNELKTTMNAQYRFSDWFVVQTGHETWYVNPNASLGSRKFYFNPRVNVSKECYLDYVSSYNQTTKNVEQEIGINYKPKALNDSTIFGIKATTVINEDRQVQSRRLKFTTDFYLF